MSQITSKEDLIAIQKKESKELFAKTQKMKHGVPKGDKKKKKEVITEITQMIADLDLKHENEMKEFEEKHSVEKLEFLDHSKEQDDVALEKNMSDLSLVDDYPGIDKKVAEGEIGAQRLSKAQKRRNKKALLAKERMEAIAKQEGDNLSGLRHMESEEIKKKLSERNLTISEVPSDGNCLYKALEHQLSLKLKQTTVQSLREETSKYMLSHVNDYIPFLTSPDTGDAMTEAEYVKYCEDIANSSIWGGHIEIQVLSHVCGFPIEVIQAEGPSIMAGDEKGNPKLILSYHRHEFGLGEHYNSVVPISK